MGWRGHAPVVEVLIGQVRRVRRQVDAGEAHSGQIVGPVDDLGGPSQRVPDPGFGIMPELVAVLVLQLLQGRQVGEGHGVGQCLWVAEVPLLRP